MAIARGVICRGNAGEWVRNPESESLQPEPSQKKSIDILLCLSFCLLLLWIPVAKLLQYSHAQTRTQHTHICQYLLKHFLERVARSNSTHWQVFASLRFFFYVPSSYLHTSCIISVLYFLLSWLSNAVFTKTRFYCCFVGAYSILERHFVPVH